MATRKKATDVASEGTPSEGSPAVSDEQDIAPDVAPEVTESVVEADADAGDDLEPSEAEMMGEDIQPVVETEPEQGYVEPEPGAVDEDAAAMRMSEADALKQLTDLADSHPSLIARLQRLLGTTEAKPKSTDGKPEIPLYQRVGSLEVNPYAQADMTRERAAKLVNVSVNMIMAFRCRGGVPDENQVVEDPQVYVSVVTRDGKHHAAPVPE